MIETKAKTKGEIASALYTRLGEQIADYKAGLRDPSRAKGQDLITVLSLEEAEAVVFLAQAWSTQREMLKLKDAAIKTKDQVISMALGTINEFLALTQGLVV